MSNFCGTPIQYQKSALSTYANSATTIDPSSVGGVPAIFGTETTSTGCSIDGTLNGATIRKSGLYLINFDANVTTTAGPGLLNAQLYLAGSPVPAAIASETTLVGDTDNISFTVVLYIPVCCMSNQTLSVVYSSTAITGLTVNHNTLNVVKLA